MSSRPTGPIMGFNTWYGFRTSINEALILQQAQFLVDSGLAAAGYQYVNLDDGWMASTRDSSGQLRPDPAKFPSGIPSLAGQIHSLGLKIGIYTAIGTRTCQNLPGSWMHYGRDADTFASWGIDFVKVDACGGLPTWANQDTVTEDFRIFGNCLYDAIPGVVYSQELPIWALVNSGDFNAAVQSSSLNSNMWRVANDESPLLPAYPIMIGHLASDLHLHGYASPGHWNDLDMVAPAYPGSGWTIQDLKNQLAIWAMEASPLLISTDVTALPTDALIALLNSHMISIDQSGQQCPTSVTVGNIQALIKPDPAGGQAVCFVNMGTGAASATFTLTQLGISQATATGRDIWTGSVTSPFSAAAITLAANTTRFMQVQGV
jgi:alpha-galactosidase